MSFDQHVSVTAQVSNSGIARAGFKLAAHLSYKNFGGGDRFRLYRREADVTADGFPADSPEGIFANRQFAQTPHPTQIALIRGTRKPTQRYSILASAVDGFVYRLGVKGEGVTATPVTHTGAVGTTPAKIHSALLTSLNAVVGNNYLAAFAAITPAPITFTATNADETFHHVAHGFATGSGPFQATNSGGALPAGLAAVTDHWIVSTGADTFKLALSLANALAGTTIAISTDGTGTQTLTAGLTATDPSVAFTVTGDAPGSWFSLENGLVSDPASRAQLSITQNHADPGVAADLAEINLINSTWFYLHTEFNSSGVVVGTATWAEANGKVYFVDVCDSASEESAVDDGDALDTLSALGFKRTVGAFHSSPADGLSAAWEGRLVPLNPGSWTAAYKTLNGVRAMKFTATATQNLDDKRASYYKTEGGRAITWEGKVGSTQFVFVDTVVALDFMIDEIQTRCFGIFVALDKVSFTDEDIALFRRAIEGALLLGQSDAYKIVAKGTPGDPDDPQPTVSFPRVRDIDPGARAIGHVPDGQVNFRLQGSAHSIDVSLTVTF